MRSSRRQRARQGSDGALQASLASAQSELVRAARLCQEDVAKNGRASTQGREALRRARKISAAIGLINEAKGRRLLPDDPDLVSEEEASERARIRRADRAEKAEARALGSPANEV